MPAQGCVVSSDLFQAQGKWPQLWRLRCVGTFFCPLQKLFVSFWLSTILSLLGIAFLVLWIMGFIAAINGEEKPMPLIGEKAQELFKGI